MREMGVRGVLIYCADYHCSHSVALNADRWPDEMRLSDVEPLFTCSACGGRGADVRPDFNWGKPVEPAREKPALGGVGRGESAAGCLHLIGHAREARREHVEQGGYPGQQEDRRQCCLYNMGNGVDARPGVLGSEHCSPSTRPGAAPVAPAEDGLDTR